MIINNTINAVGFNTYDPRSVGGIFTTPTAQSYINIDSVGVAGGYIATSDSAALIALADKTAPVDSKIGAIVSTSGLLINAAIQDTGVPSGFITYADLTSFDFGIGITPISRLTAFTPNPSTTPIITQANNDGTVQTFVGVGSPETIVTGSPGDTYYNNDTGGDIGELYIKGSGVATNTGWIQLGTGSSTGGGNYQTASQTSIAGFDTFYTSLNGSIGITNVESDHQAALFASGFTGMKLRVATNTMDQDTVVTLRVNGVSSGMTVTIPAATTGIFTSVITVPINTDDLVCSLIDTSASTVGGIDIDFINYTTQTSFTPVINAWLLTGNFGTNPVTDYVGTSDATDFEIKGNGGAGGILGAGSINIGRNATSPTTQITIGQLSSASSLNEISIGSTQSGVGDQLMTVGDDFASTGTQNIHVGVGFNGTQQVLRIGDFAIGTGDQAIVIGGNNTSTGNQSIGIGQNFVGGASQTISIGVNTGVATTTIRGGDLEIESGTDVERWPTVAGTVNQVLTTDGAGVMSWQTPGASAGVNRYYVQQTLSAGVNTLTHSLGLAIPEAVTVVVRINSTGAEVTGTLSNYTANSVDLTVLAAVALSDIVVMG